MDLRWFWECNCEEYSLHRKNKGNYCPFCGEFQSRDNQPVHKAVLRFYKPVFDRAIFSRQEPEMR